MNGTASGTASAAPAWRLADHDAPDCLVYGIGNVGRGDDGLGWAFVDAVEERGLLPRARLVRGYQVHLEDADLISTCRAVLFVDAARDLAVPFALSRPQPRFEVPFTAHALTVPTVLATCRQVFGRLPETTLLALRGTDFELGEGLTPGAREALDAALAAVG